MVGKMIKTTWGSYKTLYVGDNYKVKKVIILPEKGIKRHYHNNRDESWTILQGDEPYIIIDREVFNNDQKSLFISKNIIHEIRNFGLNDLIIIVVEFGDCKDEDIIFV